MTTTPERRTRPANRRQQILDAASELFGGVGYESVGMSDIADAVQVGPSALYRHFASKEDLLEEILDRSVTDLELVIADLDLTTPQGVLGLAEYAVDHRYFSGLIGREISHLAEASRLRVKSRLGQVSALAAERITAARAHLGPTSSLPPLRFHEADLLACAVLAVLQSPAFSHFQGPPSELAVVISRVISAKIPEQFGEATIQQLNNGLVPASRREALLARAVALFAERTYAGVRVEDVAASLDIAGPSIYNHFKSKSEILATALERGAAHLLMQTSDILATAPDQATALRKILSDYSRFAIDHPALIDLMISETRSLPEPSLAVVGERGAAERRRDGPSSAAGSSGPIVGGCSSPGSGGFDDSQQHRADSPSPLAHWGR